MPSIFTDDKLWQKEWQRRMAIKMEGTWCTRCLLHETTPGISFDDVGICSCCRQQERLEQDYPPDEEKLQRIAEEIREAGRGKKYDVVVGVSGGCDSSYLTYLSKKLGLRPLAAHYDTTWDSTIAVENIRKVLKKLEVDLFTYVVDNEESNDIQRAFFRSGTIDINVFADLGLATTLFLAAEKHGIRYLFEGHSFRSEGISPLGWCYMDARYVKTVHDLFGSMKMKSFPNLWLSSQLRWMLLRRIKKIRPLWHYDYQKEEVKSFLTREFGWQWYGGHHLENRFTTFNLTYFQPRRFGVDQRVNGYAALVRSGQMSRQEGLELLQSPPQCDMELVEVVKKRLGFDDEEFERCMSLPVKTYRDYRTYKPLFEKMRPFFYVMAKLDLVPMSFYLKYTAKESS